MRATERMTNYFNRGGRPASELKRPLYVGRRKGGTFMYEHRRRATAALGKPLPPGAQVHHHTDTQLVIFQDHAEHSELHRRLRVLRAGGDPWRDAWCSVGKHTAPLSMFTRRKSGTGKSKAGSLVTVCRECTRISVANIKARRRRLAS